MALSFELSANPSPRSEADRTAILENPGFGKHFTDHMAVATWTKDAGWHDGRVTAYGPISLMPSAAVLHYAQEIFEGLKAYRHADGSIWSFRPEANAQRMARSAARLALPVLPEEDFIASLRALVAADQAWVPEAPDGSEKSLYLRPFMYASEAFLGVRPANEVTFSVIASPAGAYFSGGLKPVTLWISSTMPARVPAARGPRSAVATTPPRSPGSWRGSSTAATRPSSSTLRPRPSSRNWAA